MIKVAIPVFQNRVSPVFDSCKHMLVITLLNGIETDRENIFFGDMSLSDRCRIIHDLDVSLIICGGISQTFAKILQQKKMELINGIAGDAQAILSALFKWASEQPRILHAGIQDYNQEINGRVKLVLSKSKRGIHDDFGYRRDPVGTNGESLEKAIHTDIYVNLILRLGGLRCTASSSPFF